MCGVVGYRPAFYTLEGSGLTEKKKRLPGLPHKPEPTTSFWDSADQLGFGVSPCPKEHAHHPMKLTTQGNGPSPTTHKTTNNIQPHIQIYLHIARKMRV